MIKNQIIVTYTKVSRRGRPSVVAVYQDGGETLNELETVLRQAADQIETKLASNGPGKTRKDNTGR